MKFAVLGGIAALAAELYRRKQQPYGRGLPGSEGRDMDMDLDMEMDQGVGMDGDADMVADTNMVSGGNPQQEQRAPQPQDWRGVQNVLE